MAQLPIYQQKYGQSSRTASAADFGAIEGQAKQQAGQSLAGLGETIANIEARKRNRKDTIERVRAINDYQMMANQEYTRLSTEDDMTDTEIPNRYNQFLKDKAEEIVNSHTGSEQSKAELAAQLGDYQGQYARQFYKDTVSAQYKAMGNYLDTTIKGLSDLAGDMPDTIEDQFQALDTELGKMSAALTQEQEQAYRENGRAQIINSAVSNYLNTGDYESAQAILEVPGVSESLTPDNQRQIKTQIIIGAREKEKAQYEAEKKLNEVRAILGREPTAEERARAAGVAPPSRSGAQTLPEKVADLERVLGRPATDAEVTKLAGAYTAEGQPGGLFGNSLKGRSLDIMNNDAAGFAAGTLDPQQEQAFITAVNEYTQPIQYQNPDTGLMETRYARVPPYVEEAFNRRGLPVPSGGQQQVSTVPLEQTPTEMSQTIWGRRQNIAGVVPALASGVGRIPVLGEFTGGGGEYTRDKQYAEGLQRDLVRVLQNNPRYAEGERKAIEQEISILSQPVDTIAAYENRLIGISENLQSRQDFAYRTANNPNVTSSERQSAMNVLNAIIQFRDHLGVPQKVKSVEEAKQLAPGTQFIDPQGRIRVVPQGGQNAGQ